MLEFPMYNIISTLLWTSLSLSFVVVVVVTLHANVAEPRVKNASSLRKILAASVSYIYLTRRNNVRSVWFDVSRAGIA